MVWEYECNHHAHRKDCLLSRLLLGFSAWKSGCQEHTGKKTDKTDHTNSHAHLLQPHKSSVKQALHEQSTNSAEHRRMFLVPKINGTKDEFEQNDFKVFCWFWSLLPLNGKILRAMSAWDYGLSREQKQWTCCRECIRVRCIVLSRVRRDENIGVPEDGPLKTQTSKQLHLPKSKRGSGRVPTWR